MPSIEVSTKHWCSDIMCLKVRRNLKIPMKWMKNNNGYNSVELGQCKIFDWMNGRNRQREREKKNYMKRWIPVLRVKKYENGK